jgi:hypothetical protein
MRRPCLAYQGLLHNGLVGMECVILYITQNGS